MPQGVRIFFVLSELLRGRAAVGAARGPMWDFGAARQTGPVRGIRPFRGLGVPGRLAARGIRCAGQIGCARRVIRCSGATCGARGKPGGRFRAALRGGVGLVGRAAAQGSCHATTKKVSPVRGNLRAARAIRDCICNAPEPQWFRGVLLGEKGYSAITGPLTTVVQS